MKNRLSIIIPVYNVEKYISRCMDSLISQDYDNYEIIVVNDGSSDSSIEIVKEYQGIYPSLITIFNQENKGISAARNSGIKMATGDYLFFVDSDDYIEQNILGKLMKFINEKTLDFLGFNITVTVSSTYKSTSNFSNYSIDYNSISTGVKFIEDYNYNNGPWWYIVSKSILIKHQIQFEEGHMAEDGSFTTETILNCDKASFVNFSIYRYVRNPKSITSSTNINHNINLMNDYILAAKRFNKLIDLARNKGAQKKTIDRLKSRQESYIFFYIYRHMKNNLDFSIYKDTTNVLSNIGLYPFNNFPYTDYNSMKFKMISYVFNRPLVYRVLLKINNLFKIIK